ncbi:hypothetical protein SAMN05216204_13317 [Massilia yuzhufengensis]|uniref:Uncharacterized protein n=1 Tax=Massilia yuzhufengensis TaxID=1164594 RepID=A0A1I1UIC8_9BURK|nr:hypothetical protein SAMN05216204_13317 [Massilia yuzhufengensis]
MRLYDRCRTGAEVRLAGRGAVDLVPEDALAQRPLLIQQAVRLHAAGLVWQVSPFLTVTLPALEMAQAQGGN